MKQIVIESIDLLNTCIACQAGGKETRYYLQGIHFETGRMTATEGHILASFPIDTPELPESGYIINFPKPYPGTVNQVVVDIDEDTRQVRIRAYKRNGQVQSDVNSRIIDAEFAKWRNLLSGEFVPTTEHRQRFNPDFLCRLTKYVATADSMPVMRFSDTGAHHVEHDSFPANSHALLMGARLD